MNTGLDVFDTSIQKTNEILGAIEEDLGWSGRRHQTYQATRIVLHALRDILTEDMSAHFAAQLPIILKGVYFDSWQPQALPGRLNLAEFIDVIACQLNFDAEGGPEQIIRVVIDKIFGHISPGEKQKVLNTLPKDIANFLG